ncbi:MAG: hypothetical protein F4X26_05955 [Chloroflexi bacterium]|nr:hypothetical protein [Chloroflexota bacterium]
MRAAVRSGLRRGPRLLASDTRAPGRSSNGRRTALTPVAVALGFLLGVLGGLGDSVEGQQNQRAAQIDVTFQANFVQDALASGETLPDDTTFASVVFATHEGSVSYFNAGEAASPGLKAFAETGAPSLLVAEFAAQTAASNVYPGQGGGATFPQTAEQEQTFAARRASAGQSHLTFVASFSESPDWFVGARNIDLRPGGVWIEELEVDLYAWDAGTDSGTEFDSADSATDLPGNVTSLEGAGKFSDTPIGTLTITMLVPPSDGSERRVIRADAGSLDGALNVFWWDGELGSVDFDRYLVAWKSGAEEFQTSLGGDRVKVVMGRSSDRVIVEGLTNGTEYTVRVAHANAVGPAVHHSREVTATPAARVRELVSNTSQNPGRPTLVHFSLRSGQVAKFGVVPFTTGSAGGTLGSVTFLRFQPLTVGGYARSLVLELHLLEDDGGGPGPVIGTLVPPPEYVDGPSTFVAPGNGFALSASTDYWLKLVLVEGELNTFVARHRDEDPTGQPGWLLGQDCWVSITDVWPYRVKCSVGTDVTHGPFLMSLNSPIESTLPRASISGGAAIEGGSVDFTVELSRAPGATATVQYSTVDGSGALPATSADGDYTPVTNETITFGANETSKTISIATGDDSTDETNERFLVRLSSPSANIVLSEVDTAAGAILNDDQTRSSDSTLAGITVTDQDGNTIALNETFERYRFVYTADAPGSVDTLTFTPTFDSGVNPYALRYFNARGKVEDRTGRSANFTVAPGLNLLKVLITSNNRRQESLYKVMVTKAASSDATLSRLLVQDDGLGDLVLSPAFSPSVTEYTATAGGPAPFYIEVTPNHAGADVQVTLNDRTIAFSGTHFTDETVHVVFDLVGGANTLVVQVTAEDGATRTYTLTVTVPPRVKFGQGPFSVDEGSTVSVPVILNQAAPTALTIPLTVTSEGGAGASDYSVPASVEFMVGDTEQSVVFTAAVDSDADAGESVRLGFGALPGDVSSVAPTTARVEITDVAPTPVNFEQASYTVAEGGSVTVRVTLDTAAVARVDIPIMATNQGGATSVDYTTLPATVTINGGDTAGSFTFSAVDDSAVEPGESVRLSLGALPAGYVEGSTSATVVNISDDDVAQVAVSFGSAAYSVAEGASGTLTVHLSADPQRTVTIPLSRTHQGGASSSDYTLPSSVTFNSGDTTRTVSFLGTDDSVDDDGESVRLGFTSLPAGVSAGTPTETVVSIVDDDDPEVTVSFASAGYTIPESAAESMVVVLDRDPERRVEVMLTVTPVEAIEADFDVEWPDPASPGVLVFSAGVTRQTVTFSSLTDDEEEDEETVVISIDTPSADRVTLGPVSATTVTIDARPATRFSGGLPAGTPGGGGPGGPSGPTPSEIDFEWTVQHDIEALDPANDWPTGSWSDGRYLYLAQNGSGADDGVYAYDLATGERVEEREFELDGSNRAPRGIWADGTTAWVSDSGQDKLFAYDLATGERVEERDMALARRNRDARGIWAGDGVMWVLDGGKDSLFAYDLATGEFLAEYELADANSDPHGVWPDEVTVWVSDHGAKRLFAYRLPPPPAEPQDETEALERVVDEEFAEPGRVGNNSPRGIWSDGAVMYIADENDNKVYSYNMPDGIDARLASLTLEGVEIGEFDPMRRAYEGTVAAGVTSTTVGAVAAQDGATVAIDPADADAEADGHQVALTGVDEIAVTVTSAEGSRERVYRVAVSTAGPPPSCLRGAVSVGFSLVAYEGGSVDDLVACAERRHVTALYALEDGAWVSHIVGAPDFVNAPFRALFADGVPALHPLVVRSEGPATPAPPAPAVTEPFAACLRGEVAAGFSLVVYGGGSVDDFDACAERLGVTAVYVLVEGEWVSYILAAPEFVNARFRALFADGVPAGTPLVVRGEGP